MRFMFVGHLKYFPRQTVGGLSLAMNTGRNRLRRAALPTLQPFVVEGSRLQGLAAPSPAIAVKAVLRLIKYHLASRVWLP